MKRLFGRFAFFLFLFFYSMYGYSQILITSTGTLNNFVVNYPANITGLQSGMEITFFSNQTITNSPSLNINLTGLRPIFKNINQSLSNGEIKAGQAVSVVFDGTNWQLMSAVSPSTATGFWSTLGNASDSSAYFIGTTNTEPLIFKTSSQERMRISRAGRFGFNMNPTPASMFNIKSIGNGAILTVNRSTDAGPIIELTETGGGNARIDMYTSLNANVVQIPSGPGNIFFAGGGNLGVNTTAPGNTLHVAGGARIGNLTNAGVVFSNSNGDLFTTSTSGILSGIGATDQVAWFTNTSSVTSSNNLTFTSSKSQLIVGINNNNNASNTYGLVIGQANTISGGRSFVSGVSNIVNNSQTAAIGEGLFSNGRSGIVVGGYNPNVSVALNNFNNAFEVGIGTAPSNSIFGLVVKYLGISPGIVGIGTDNPQNTLHVVGGVRIGNLSSTGNYFVQTNSTGDLFISTNTGQSAFWALGGNSVPGIRTIGTTNNFDLPIIANNLERMRILTNGNIGIRTTIPGATLDLKGAGSATGIAFRVLDSGGATSFNVLDNGATGIGTTAISGYQLYLQTATADPNYRSLVISNDYSGAIDKYGIYNSITGNGSGSKIAIYNLLTGLAGDASIIYGEYTNMDPFGTGTAYGNRVRLTSNGTGIRYGMYSEVYGAASNNSPIYGVLGYVNHTGTATGAASYSFYGQNASTGAGNQYGIYTISEQYNYHAGSLGLGILIPTEKLDVSGNTEVTGDYKYASPKVRYKSLSAASFMVESNLYYLNHVGSYAYVAGGTLGSTAALYANLDLPDNSTITGLYFYYVDNNATYGIGPAYIYEVQSNLGVTPNFTTSFNTTASTAAANATTISLQSNLTDTPLLVDNDTKSYMVVLSTVQNTSTLRIVRCRVRYIVPNAD